MILITGAKGQLGNCIVNHLKNVGTPFIGVDRDEFDITDRYQTIEFFKRIKPDSVIHCSAYSNVEMAEDEPDLCIKVNMEGTENIAIACSEVGAKLLYISTDYVFDGKKQAPYEPDDMVNPLSVYGNSKALGEEKVKEYIDKYFIVRTSWLFGKNSSNFVETMLNLGKKERTLNVVKDQVGSPTYAEDLAPLLITILNSEKYGIYHITNEGFCSWAEFAKEIMVSAGLSCEIVPISSNEFHYKAIRPKNSRLSKEKLSSNDFIRLPAWQDALHRYLKYREER